MLKKRIIGLGLVWSLGLSMIAGCSPKEVSSTTKTPDTSVGTGTSLSESGATEGVTGERPTISVMTIDHFGSPLSGTKSEDVIKQMEEYTNTKVNFTWVADDSYKEKLGVTLMDKSSMPMIITVPEMTPSIVAAAQAGAFWNLSEAILDKDLYPNLSQANPDVNKQIIIGGNLSGIYRARPIGRQGLGYRHDWADKLGLTEPKTIEDVYNMAKAFRENDPDGNGKKDTYGIALSKYTGPFDIMQTWFGTGNGWVEENGQLLPVHQTSAYLEAVNWLRKMYEEDLVYPDFAVRDTSTWPDSVKNGECGIFIDVLDGSRRIWDYFVNNSIPAVNGDPTASMNLVGAIAKDASSPAYTLATSGANGFYFITKAAKTPEDLANCLHFLDKMCDDEMIILSAYGLQDVDWKLDEQGFIEILNPDLPLNQHNKNGLDQVVAFIPNAIAKSPSLKSNERIDLELKIKEENISKAVFNPAIGYLVNSETYSMNGANLIAILDDARTQYICGQIDEKGLEEAWKNWENQGGMKVIEEVNTLYKEDKK